MHANASDAIFNSLQDLIKDLEDGDRLPTVRELMRKYGVGQASVQDAFARLKERGLVSSQVGRGSYVVKPGTRRLPSTGREAPAAARSPELRSLLILSNASMNERCILVQNRIVDEVRALDGKVVQVSYHDTNHLMEILQSVPTFDATVLQSHYEVIPVRLLGLLQGKTRVLVVDGHSITGVDVDRMGIDWEEAIIAALDHLTGLGHTRITLVSLESSAPPIVNAVRFFGRASNWRGRELGLTSIALPGLRHPSQYVASGLSNVMKEIRQIGPTAVLFLGVSDAMGIRQVMNQEGLEVPGDLSVVILGHPDVPTEHLGWFSIIGGSHAEGAAQLLDIIRSRLANPDLPPQIRYIGIRTLWGASSAVPRG